MSATGIEWLDTLAWQMLHASWQGGVLALVVLAVSLALGRRLDPRLRFALWLIVFARLALPVVPTTPWSMFGWVPRGAPDAIGPASPASRWPVAMVERSLNAVANVGQVDDREPVDLLEVDVAARGESAPLGWAVVGCRALVAIWMLGATLLLARLGWTAWQLRRRKRSWTNVEDGALLATLQECRGELACRRAVSLFISPGEDGPAVCGLWKSAIVLPQSMLEATRRDDLRLVLLHEVMHVRRWDVLTGCLAAVVTVIHWFNPLAWLAKARLYQDRELACDAAVLARFAAIEARAYGRLLLRAAESANTREPLPATVGIWGWNEQSLLQMRIQMVATYRKPRALAKLLAAIAVVSMIAVGLTDVRSEPAPADGQLAPPPLAQSATPGGAAQDAAKPNSAEPEPAAPAPKEIDWKKPAADRRNAMESLKWTTLGNAEKMAVIDKIATQTRGNFEKIKTWRASADVAIDVHLTEEQVKERLASVLSEDDAAALIEQSRFKMTVVLDLVNNKYFGDKTGPSLEFATEKERLPLKQKTFGDEDERNIFTPEHQLQLHTNRTWPGFIAVLNVPRTQGKRAVFRWPPGETTRPDRVDPRCFFGFRNCPEISVTSLS